MTSRLNALRYGTLQDIVELMDGDKPLDEFELRALIFNLAGRLLDADRKLHQMTGRVIKLERETSNHGR